MSGNNIYLFITALYLSLLLPDFIKVVKYARNLSPEINIRKLVFRLHLIMLTMALFLSVLLILFKVNIFDYSSPIAYEQIDEITFKDFNGLKQPNKTVQGSEKFAFIVSEIELQVTKSTIQITSYFHPARSYVYQEELQDDALLTHELYHFRITEFWSRKLREELSEFAFRPTQNEIDELYVAIISKRDAMQESYDYETNHSYLMGKQLKWQAKIDSSLQVMNTFKSTFVHY